MDKGVVWPSGFSAEIVEQAFGGSRLSSYTIALEAWRRGLTVEFFDERLRRYRISDGEHSVSLNDSRPSSMTGVQDYTRLLEKGETKRILGENGVSVPRGVVIDFDSTSEEQLRNFADSLGYPLVLKPNTGTMGQGVLTAIDTWDRLLRNFQYLGKSLGASSIVMEQHFEGDDFRVLVVGGRALAACKRIPANVLGNGKSTVSQLIRRKNRDRRKNPFLSKGIIRVDYELEETLERQGLSLEDVPVGGQYVQLRQIANASAGGDVQDVTDDLPQEILDAAVRSVAAVPNIFIAGVDVLFRPGDGSSPDRYTVIEMNSRPHIALHMYPTHGVGRDVPKEYIDFLFPNTERPRISGDEMLAFDVELMAPVLRAGVSSSVKIAPLPAHHFPVRWLISYEAYRKEQRLSWAQRNRIHRLARAEEVAGKLYRQGGALQLLVGAASARKARYFRDSVSEILANEYEPVTKATLWKGPLRGGFRIMGE